MVVMIMASYAFCAAQTTPNPSAAALVIQLVAVAVVLRVAHMSRAIRRIGWTLVAVAVVGVLVVGITGASGRWLDLTLSGISAAAYLAAPVAIVIHQLRRRIIDGQALLAAISAYILIGMWFTFVYNFAALLAEESIFGTGEINSLGSQVFFSFTTLTTTGYGNLVPSGPVLQSVAIAEAITGQLFLVIAVARIVTGLDPQTARELAREAKESRRARKAHEAGER
ncbi:ion channel [Salinibacterium sp. ZJ454]|uniref:ion channel n=1 Tax=Salinibacterium sp. ZJ454 TaxID=2708339 RepID=UPI001FB8B212|nr:ion channel [Salinibacterium sp. ZJ454]